MQPQARTTRPNRRLVVTVAVVLLGVVATAGIAAGFVGILGPRDQGVPTTTPTVAATSPTRAADTGVTSPAPSPIVAAPSPAAAVTPVPTSVPTSTVASTATPPPPTPVPTATVVPSPANPATATQQAIVELNRQQQEKFEKQVRTQYRHDAETTARLRPQLVPSLERALKAIEEATSAENPDLPALKESLAGGELERWQRLIQRQKGRDFFIQMRYQTRIMPDAYYYPSGEFDEVNGLIVWLDPSPSRIVTRQGGASQPLPDRPGCVFLFFSNEEGTYKLTNRAGLNATFCGEQLP